MAKFALALTVAANHTEPPVGRPGLQFSYGREAGASREALGLRLSPWRMLAVLCS